jgi:hypothetical protein
VTDADAETTVREYYEALRRGDPLPPFFAESEGVGKVGISERLVGFEAVAEGLRSQTRHTEDWEVESRDLGVTERGCHAWFGDSVRMAWTDTRTGTRRGFDTRWSGTLERGEAASDGNGDGWTFVSMHVSAPSQL